MAYGKSKKVKMKPWRKQRSGQKPKKRTGFKEFTNIYYADYG